MGVIMFQYILFDLDGTLTDPKEGITKSVQYALAHFNIDEVVGSELDGRRSNKAEVIKSGF